MSKKSSITPTIIVFFLLLTGVFPAFTVLGQESPSGILLTWKEDPTTTMSLDWHNTSGESQTLIYRLKGNTDWKKSQSNVLDFPFSDRKIHRVFLRGLTPDHSYEVKFGNDTEVYYFKTMPADISKEPIRIAIGGDTMHDQRLMEMTNKQVAKYDPHFAIIGGDLAYANGDQKNLNRWYEWFDAVKNTLIMEDGRIIPMILGIGNHEVQGGYMNKHEDFVANDENRKRIAPFYYTLFSFPDQPGYGVLDFGKYFSLILLDSDHSNPIEGVQTEWFKRELAIREEVTHLVAMYHVPAYPSVRDYNGSIQTKVREYWTPLIEKSGIRLVFENHDHAYKRTYPIKNNGIHQDGIVYIGDGSWGTSPREVHDAATTWYLEKSQSINAFTLLTLQGKAYSLISVDHNGNIIDSYPAQPTLK
ncbi:MAG: metallophosphoesterase family protein [Cyclobacteriaceae bacterium]